MKSQPDKPAPTVTKIVESHTDPDSGIGTMIVYFPL